MLNETAELALKMIASIMERETLYEAANDCLKALDTDFPSRVTLIDGGLWRPLVDLIDSAAGDTAASYFLEESRHMKNGGFIQERDGTKWPMKTLPDLRAYLEHLSQQPAA